MKHIAYLSIGSNIGNRLQQLKNAVQSLHNHPKILVTNLSSVYETKPVGVTDQADFLNMVVEIQTNLIAEQLLAICQQIEHDQGRVRTIRWGPRTVDLDILLFNHDNIKSENLIVPHPRMEERAFVYIPLLEIAPNVQHPVTGEPFAHTVPNSKNGVVCWMKRQGVESFLEDTL